MTAIDIDRRTLVRGAAATTLAGGLLLLWIGVRLMAPAHDAHENVKPADKLISAIKAIIVADAVMSLDNVLAIAGIAALLANVVNNLPAVLVALSVMGLLIAGTRESATLNIVLVVIKLTALAVLMGFLVPSAGRVMVGDADLAALDVGDHLAGGLCLVGVDHGHRDHRHLGLAADALDQALAAARDDHVHVLRHGDQGADGGAVGRVHDLDGVDRQAGRGDRADGVHRSAGHGVEGRSARGRCGRPTRSTRTRRRPRNAPAPCRASASR